MLRGGAFKLDIGSSELLVDFSEGSPPIGANLVPDPNCKSIPEFPPNGAKRGFIFLDVRETGNCRK